MKGARNEIKFSCRVSVFHFKTLSLNDNIYVNTVQIKGKTKTVSRLLHFLMIFIYLSRILVY